MRKCVVCLRGLISYFEDEICTECKGDIRWKLNHMDSRYLKKWIRRRFIWRNGYILHIDFGEIAIAMRNTNRGDNIASSLLEI